MRPLSSRLTLAALALLVCAAAPVSAQSSATEEPTTGVWWQGMTSGGGLPPPPLLVDLPEGGLWLSSGPNGDSAVSAVRFSVPSSGVAERLTLRVREDSSTPALSFALCAPENEWTPPAERPGPFEERALPDCEAMLVEGAETPDGTAVEFALSGFGPGEEVDLVLTRLPDDTGSYLNVTFEKPVASDLRVGAPVSGGGFSPTPNEVGGGGESPASPGSSSAPSPGPSFTPSPASGGGGVRFDSPSGGGSFDTPASGLNVTPAPVAVPSAPADGGTGTTLQFVEGDGQEVASPVVNAIQDPWDAARYSALVMFGALCLWIAAIVSRRLAGGDMARERAFTLYRGSPP